MTDEDKSLPVHVIAGSPSAFFFESEVAFPPATSTKFVVQCGSNEIQIEAEVLSQSNGEPCNAGVAKILKLDRIAQARWAILVS